MAQYRDDNSDRVINETTGAPLGSMPPYEPEDDMIVARERRGFSPWGIVGAGIVVILIAAAGFAMWPTATTEPTSTAATRVEPVTPQPAGQPAVDTNSATGSIKPPEAVDGNSNPAGNGVQTPTAAPNGAAKTQ